MKKLDGFFSSLNFRNTLPFYVNTTKDIAKNIFDLKNIDLYNRLDYLNVLAYAAISFFVAYMLLFLPIAFKIDGSINVQVLFFKLLILNAMIAFIYAFFILLIKRKYLFKKVFLILLLIYSFSFPLICLLHLPIFLGLENLSIDFFIGGGNNSIPNFSDKSLFFNLYYMVLSLTVQIIVPIVLPTIWLSQALEIKWWIVLVMTLLSPIITAPIIITFNQLTISLIKDVDKVVNIAF